MKPDTGRVEFLLDGALIQTLYSKTSVIPGPATFSDWETWSYTFANTDAPGTYTLEAKVVNAEANALDSWLGVDGVTCLALEGVSECSAGSTNEPPVISSVTADPSVLGPPNHKMREVTVTVDVSDDSGDDPTCEIVLVTSDDDIASDGEITGDLTVNLRAERSGKGDGRVYTITVECSDGSDTSTSTVEVLVPHDNGK